MINTLHCTTLNQCPGRRNGQAGKVPDSRMTNPSSSPDYTSNVCIQIRV